MSHSPCSLIKALAPFALAVATTLAFSFATTGDAAAQGSPPSSVPQRDAKDPRWIWGAVTVNGTPEQVWARVERVDMWPQILTDIARMKVRDHRASKWSIDLETKTFGHGMHGFEVETSADRVVKLSTDTLGVHVLAVTRVKPGPTPTQSVVSYSTFIQLNGPASLLISEKSLREKQAHMAAVSLADIARAFGTAPTP